MKTSKIIIWMFVIAVSFYALRSSAINRDLFPNINSVQPIPIGPLPNISGNIDWPNAPGEQDPNASTSVNNPTDPNNQNSPGNTATNQNNGSNVNTPNSTENIGTQNSLGNYPPSNSSNGTLNSTGNSGTQNNNGTYGSFGNPQNNPYPSSFDSGMASFSESESGQTQSAPAENVESPNNSATKQDSKQPQGAISQSTYAWAIAFGSMILLAAAFVLWRLKKLPNDVN